MWKYHGNALPPPKKQTKVEPALNGCPIRCLLETEKTTRCTQKLKPTNKSSGTDSVRIGATGGRHSNHGFAATGDKCQDNFATAVNTARTLLRQVASYPPLLRIQGLKPPPMR